MRHWITSFKKEPLRLSRLYLAAAGLLPPGTVAPGLIAQVSPAHPVVAAGCSICPAGFSHRRDGPCPRWKYYRVGKCFWQHNLRELRRKGRPEALASPKEVPNLAASGGKERRTGYSIRGSAG